MGFSKSNPSTAQVKLLVSPSSGRIPWPLLSWLALGSGTVFLVAVILSGARLIVDPYSPNWLKRAFPGLVTSFEAAPQTVEEIRAELRSKDLTAGSPVAWPEPTTPNAWFYPILQDRSIQELWVYRVRGEQLQRMDQVAIRPLKESFITTPLVGTASQVASVDSNAELSSVKLMPGTSAETPWLLLEGQRRYGNTVMRYGQILSYQTSSHRLHQLLRWSSPVAQPLQWHRSETGDQLVVDQTVGLRPSFLLYQLVPNDPPQLKEISLYRSVYDSGLKTSLYDKALQLAQGAVWSHSLQMMRSAKESLAEAWSPEAEHQLTLIQLHAERTEGQTKQTWSSQQQHILAYLIDGQWGQALETLENNPDIYNGTLKRLERDFEPLWRQVTVHLKVHPQDAVAQIWGALLVTARQSPEAGEEWLTKKTSAQKVLKRLRALGKPENAIATGAAPDLVTATPDTLPIASDAGRYLSLVGEAVAVGAPGDGWLRSQNPPSPVPGQTWYHIQVQQLQDGSGWGIPSGGSTTAANFWADSLSLRRQLQLFKHDQPIAGLAVHGVKKSGTQLKLLAIGPDLAGASLVTTSNSLQWLTTLPWRSLPPLATASAALNESSDDALDHSTTLLQVPGAPPSAEMLMAEALGTHLDLSFEQVAQLFPHLRYASIDLVGDGAVEHLFSISEGRPPELNLPSGSTLVLSSTGSLLYSDVNQPRSLLGFTTRSSQGSAALLIEQAGRYSFMGL
ncbi:MAG: hypothetical protein AAF959_09940 [Cyanobacteria bacterium P01_D01_bin.56]